jgi:hypothetical protein
VVASRGSTDRWCPEKALGVVGDDETVEYSFHPHYATVRAGENWSSPTVLLTSRRMVIVKDRLFGNPRADFEVDWVDVSGVTGQLWMGGGPNIQLVVSGARLVSPVEFIVGPQFAAKVESAIRHCYLEPPP